MFFILSSARIVLNQMMNFIPTSGFYTPWLLAVVATGNNRLLGKYLLATKVVAIRVQRHAGHGI